MNSLVDGPLAEVLNSLLDAAAAQRPPGHPHRPGPRATTPRPGVAEDFRTEFQGAEQRFMAVSPETGKLLYTLGRVGHARTVIEFGTSFGVSTLFLAAALRDNGSGLLIGTEFEPAKVNATRASISKAGVDDIVQIRAGDALQTLAVGLPPEISLVLLDGAKSMYLDILRLLEPHLTAGAVVVADNARRAAGYQDYVRDHPDYVTTEITELDPEITCRTRAHP